MALGDDPSLPPQPEIPQQMRSHNLLSRGDRTFEKSVNRRMHTKSHELSGVMKALVDVQNMLGQGANYREALRRLDMAIAAWEKMHPKEVQNRGRLLSELKRELEVKMRLAGLPITQNNHIRFEKGLGIEDLEHGQQVNLWTKTRGALWLASTVGSTGTSVGTNLSGGGTLAMVGLGTTVFTITAATGVGLVVGGCVIMAVTTFATLRAANSSRRHKKKLERILDNAGEYGYMCTGIAGSRVDQEGHQELLDSVLPYIIAQKRKKMIRRGIGSIPLISLGETIRSVSKKVRKTVKGTLGRDRELNSRKLARHLITHDCLLAQAIVAELFSDQEEEWIRYQEFPVVTGLLMEKLKSV